MIAKTEKKSAATIFFLSLLLCLGGGWLTGLVTEHGIKNWYPLLIKPNATPPNIAFPIVWTLLYICMAISLTLLVLSDKSSKNTAYIFFGLQLFLNFIWSPLFFFLHCTGCALIDLTLLWLAVIFTITSFWPFTKVGSFLLVPYLLWLSYAFYLNAFIWLKN